MRAGSALIIAEQRAGVAVQQLREQMRQHEAQAGQKRLALEALNSQPVSVGIEADKSVFQLYKSTWVAIVGVGCALVRLLSRSGLTSDLNAAVV